MLTKAFLDVQSHDSLHLPWRHWQAHDMLMPTTVYFTLKSEVVVRYLIHLRMNRDLTEFWWLKQSPQPSKRHIKPSPVEVMCTSFVEPPLPMRFKMAECNYDHTLSRCVTVSGNSERSQYWEDLRHAPDSSPSSFSCHSHWEAARPAATGHCRSCGMEGCWQVKRSPLTAPPSQSSPNWQCE